MKISSHQVRAALAAYIARRAQLAHAAPSALAAVAEPVDGLEDRLHELPDERETIVHQLRRKVRRGRYFVSSRDIVDALLGRLTADLLNQE